MMAIQALNGLGPQAQTLFAGLVGTYVEFANPC